MTTLNPPVYTDPDAAQAEIDLKAQYEAITGKTLYAAQPETLLANWAAYLKTIEDTAIQYTGEQELINYAVGDNLDQLGALWGDIGLRLPAESSVTTLQFTLIGALGFNKVIPSGTRVRSQDNQFLFATDSNLTILAGNTTGIVTATCTTTGVGSNGYEVGEINILFDLISDVDTVANTTKSVSGADVEDDERYRERLKLAPNALTVGGSRDSYIFWALSADSSIVDVAVRSPTPADQIANKQNLANELAQKIIDDINANHGGTSAVVGDINDLILDYIYVRYFYVEVYVLTDTGSPSPEIITKVSQTLNGDTIRPLNDAIVVKAPIDVNFSISASITAYENTDISTLQENLDNAIANYTNSLSTKMGKDVILSQIVDVLSLDGVYEVILNSPSSNIPIDFNERAVATSTIITIVGTTTEDA